MYKVLSGLSDKKKMSVQQMMDPYFCPYVDAKKVNTYLFCFICPRQKVVGSTDIVMWEKWLLGKVSLE